MSLSPCYLGLGCPWLGGSPTRTGTSQKHFMRLCACHRAAESRLVKPGEQGEPGILSTWLGLSKLLLQPRAWAGICAQPGHGTVCHRESKTQNGADFFSQKSLQLSQAALESTDTGKKGNQQGLCCVPSGAAGFWVGLASPSPV